VTARFIEGERVRTRATKRAGHTRLPAYLCDRRGVVESVQGLFALPDERALGTPIEQCAKEMLYTIVFDGHEVWRDPAVEPMTVSADLWDSYLEPEPAQ
jgi:nitrile hydratase